VRIWDRATGTCTATLTGHTDWVMSVAIAPDGTWLATTSGDRTVRIWDRATGTCTATLTGHTDWVMSVAIAPDGTWLATTSDDRTVRIWAVPEQRTMAMARTEAALTSCSWGALGELAVGSNKGLFLFALLT
jgi:WD40 repeat protein